MNITFKNMTPHAINIYSPSGEVMLEVPPSGEVARCAEQRAERPALNGVPVSVASYGDVTGLPDAQPGFAYIVSGMVLSACPDRPDVFAPGPALRDGDGRIVGCIGLSCTPAYQGPDDNEDDEALAKRPNPFHHRPATPSAPSAAVDDLRKRVDALTAAPAAAPVAAPPAPDGELKIETYRAQSGKWSYSFTYPQGTAWTSVTSFQNGPSIKATSGQWVSAGDGAAKLNPALPGTALIVTGSCEEVRMSREPQDADFRPIAGGGALNGGQAAYAVNMPLNARPVYIAGYKGRTGRWYRALAEGIRMNTVAELRLLGVLPEKVVGQ